MDVEPLKDVAADLPEEVWPPTAREMFEVVGRDLALKIIAEFGGVNVTVPSARADTARPSRFALRLAGFIGDEAAKKFIARFGGAEMSIPSCRAALRLARDKRIQAKYMDGATPAQIAAAEGMTERNVWRILKLPI